MVAVLIVLHKNLVWNAWKFNHRWRYGLGCLQQPQTVTLVSIKLPLLQSATLTFMLQESFENFCKPEIQTCFLLEQWKKYGCKNWGNLVFSIPAESQVSLSQLRWRTKTYRSRLVNWCSRSRSSAADSLLGQRYVSQFNSAKIYSLTIEFYAFIYYEFVACMMIFDTWIYPFFSASQPIVTSWGLGI